MKTWKNEAFGWRKKSWNSPPMAFRNGARLRISEDIFFYGHGHGLKHQRIALPGCLAGWLGELWQRLPIWLLTRTFTTSWLACGMPKVWQIDDKVTDWLTDRIGMSCELLTYSPTYCLLSASDEVWQCHLRKWPIRYDPEISCGRQDKFILSCCLFLITISALKCFKTKRWKSAGAAVVWRRQLEGCHLFVLSVHLSVYNYIAVTAQCLNSFSLVSGSLSAAGFIFPFSTAPWICWRHQPWRVKSIVSWWLQLADPSI